MSDMRFDMRTACIASAMVAAITLSACGKSGSSTAQNTTDSKMVYSGSTDTSTGGAPASSAPEGASGGKVIAGDPVHGKQIFTQNCAQCHGASGTEGGIGPSLKGEKARKDTAAAIAWIKNPQAPMPKLYPSPLDEKDVADVAAYVESL